MMNFSFLLHVIILSSWNAFLLNRHFNYPTKTIGTYKYLQCFYNGNKNNGVICNRIKHFMRRITIVSYRERCAQIQCLVLVKRERKSIKFDKTKKLVSWIHSVFCVQEDATTSFSYNMYYIYWKIIICVIECSPEKCAKVKNLWRIKYKAPSFSGDMELLLDADEPTKTKGKCCKRKMDRIKDSLQYSMYW